MRKLWFIKRCFILSTLVVPLLLVAGPANAVTPEEDPAGSAASWLLEQYEDHPDTFGLGGNAGDVADLIFALAAAGVAGGEADRLLTELESLSSSYVSGGAGPLAKVLLATIVAGGDGSVLEADLRASAASGEFDALAFNQALAIVALAATDAGVPDGAVAHLADLQCADGSFGWGECPGDVDTTALAAQALLAAGGDAEGAITWLLDAQLDSGAFDNFGPSPNSTGVAAMALRAAGETVAADAAAAWVASQQAGCDGGDAGAIGDPAAVFSVEFATMQGLLAFDAPRYDQLDLTTASAAAPVVCAQQVVDPVVDTGTDDVIEEGPDEVLADTGAGVVALVLVAGLLLVFGAGLLRARAER